MYSLQSIPCLQLESYSPWHKWPKALRFFSYARNVIASQSVRKSQTFFLGDRKGCTIGISSGDVRYVEDGANIRLLEKMLVSIEDKRFYSHCGLDFCAMIRALIANIRNRKIVQGASTITQQLVRNTLITADRSVVRKLLEALLAVIFEKHYSKDEILALYCNHVYMGMGTRGFGAASKVIFRKPFRKLTCDEMLALIGLLRSPEKNHPVKNRQNFYQRQEFICDLIARKPLGRQLQVGPLSKEVNPIEINHFKKGRYTNIVKSLIGKEYNTQELPVSRVTLTIDKGLQRIVDEVLREASNESNTSAGACVILLNNASEIVAESSWQRGVETESSPAFHGKIQPGSTYKTFALLAALEQGFSLGSRFLSEPFQSEFITNSDNEPWTVRNYGHLYHAELTLEDALVLSDNTVFASLSEVLNLPSVMETYEKYRLLTGKEQVYAICLGACKRGISLLRLAAGYAAIARNGVYKTPIFIKNIQIADGSFYWSRNTSLGSVISDYKSIMQLKRVLLRSGFHYNGVAFSGKTGTTKDASLFAGYNDKISAAIWLKHSEPEQEGDQKSKSALKVFKGIVDRALGYKSEYFTV